MPQLIEVGKPSVVFKKFTRAEVKDAYETRRQNRTISLPVIRKYRDLYNNGGWRDFDRAQAPVMFAASDKKLAAGQHRFGAALESDKQEFVFPVLEDATEEEILNQDNCFNRTLKHQVEMFHNVPASSKLQTRIVSACRTICETVDDVKYPSAECIANKIEAYKDALETANDISVPKGLISRSAPVLAAFLWTKSRMDESKWKEAFISFDQGTDLKQGIPLQRLREQLTGPGYIQKRAKGRQKDFFLRTVGALKSYHLDKTTGNLIANEVVLEGW